MTTFSEDLEIIPITPEHDEAELVKLFEKETGKTLYPAQSERVQISIINKLSNLMKIKFNEALKNQFLPYAKGIFLDIFGAFLGCPRLLASQAVSTLLIKLYEAFSFDKVVPRGSEIETIDGEYVFTTDEDVVIPAGELSAQVQLTSVLAGSALNYKKDEINNLIENYEYIESVTNITDAVGGSDEESDDAYRERLYIAAEKSSTTGTRLGYKYFAMSADKSITDVQVECVQENASISMNGETYTETNGIVDNNLVHAEIDYKSGIFSVTLKEQSLTLDVKIPPCAKIDIYALTNEGQPSTEIINKIYASVNTDERRPLSDYVVVSGAVKKTFNIKCVVYIASDADYEAVKKLVNEALNSYLNELKLKLNQAIIPSKIISVIQNIEGVVSVDLEDPVRLPADTKTFYSGEIENIEFKRAL